MTSLKKENTVIGILLIVLSVYYGYLTSQLQFRKAAQGIGPDSMPYIFAAALFVLSIFLIIEGYVKDGAAANSNPLGLKMILRVAMLFGIIAAYVLVVIYVSFLVATPLFVAVLLYLGESRKPVEIILTSVLVTAGVYILFNLIFQVRI
jgi:hypothetical protein